MAAKLDDDSGDIPPPLPPPLPPFLERCGPTIAYRLKQPGKLFEHQKMALEKTLNWFSDPKTANKIAVISMPTGSGKTGVICCLPYFLGKHAADKKLLGINLKKPILVIAPGKDILDQLEDNISGRDKNAFLLKKEVMSTEEEVSELHYNVHVIRTGKDIAPNLLNRHQICLVNVQKGHFEPKSTTRELYTWDKLPEDSFSVVIVDEAHHYPSNRWKIIKDRFKAHAKIVFFTATPFRCDKKKITEDINMTGLSYHLTRREAVQKRFIRDINPIDLEGSQVSVGEDTGSKLALQKTKEMLHKIYQRRREKPPFPDGTEHMAILIVSSTENAQLIADEWNQRFSPSKAAVMHSKMHQSHREAVMTELRMGKLALIVIVQMLLEGFDHPPISIAAIGTKIRSPVKFTQFVGRALRIYRPGREIESEDIKADIISDPFFKQAGNYAKFISEELIPIKDEED